MPAAARRSAVLFVLCLLPGLVATASTGATAAPAQPLRLVATAPDKHPQSRFDPHTLLVRFRDGSASRSASSAADRVHGTIGAAIGRTGYVVLHVQNAKRALRSLRTDDAVGAAQLNYVRHADLTPNDDLYKTYQQKYFSALRIPQAFDVTTGSTGTNIAIVDTGVDLAHPDIKGKRLKAGYDFVNDDSTPQDDNGHGTFVAGAAAAITNNTTGVAGAAWSAGIIPVKVLDAEGSGTDAQVASGITWAADHGAKIINLSLGGPDDSQVLSDAIDYAVGKDVLVVAAAGNDGHDDPSYPAAYPSVLAVSATDRGGTFSYFSNYGWWVDLSAPGMFITSTYWYKGQHTYATGFGTSFAAPLVSATAALVRVKNPTWSRSKVFSQLESTAQDRGPSGIDPFYGWGFLDAYAAVGGSKQAPAAVPAADSLEPDGTINRANLLSGTISNATISPEGDVDWFKATATSTGSLTFTVTPPTADPEGDRTLEMDPVLAVYGPAKTLISTADDTFVGQAEHVTIPATAGSTYYLRVANYLGSRSSAAYTVAFSNSTAVPPPRFAAPDYVAAGNTPRSSLIADVTGDGRADVLETTSTPDTPRLFVFPQQADGTLGSPTTFSFGPFSAGELAAGDLDGDGLTDVAVAAVSPADQTKGEVDVFHQSDGTLGASVALPTTSVPQELDIADIDGDGDGDIVAQLSAGLVLLVNTESGFVESSPLSTDAHRDIDVADVSGDGRPDIVAMCGTASATCSLLTLDVFVQRSDGSFETHPYSLTTFGYGVEAADVDGDGRTDVVVAVHDNSTSKLDILIQNDDGTLGSPTTRSSATDPMPVEAADLNGDGLMDIVVAHYGAFGVYMQGATGLGSESVFSVALTAFDFTGLAGGDINGDGLTDLLGAGIYALRQLPPPDVPAEVLTTTPTDFATGVSRTIDPSVTFGVDLDATSITSSTVYLRNGNKWGVAGVTLVYDAVTRKLTLDRSKSLDASTPYVVFVDGVRDADGNALPLFTFRFKTGT